MSVGQKLARPCLWHVATTLPTSGAQVLNPFRTTVPLEGLSNGNPQSLSGETRQDSEPNIAVNPANPQQIAISAFTPDPMGGPNAPIFISTNSGTTWTLNNIIGSTSATTGTGDITLRTYGIYRSAPGGAIVYDHAVTGG